MSYFNDFVVRTTFIAYFRWFEAHFNHISLFLAIGLICTKDQFRDRILDGLYGKLRDLWALLALIHFIQLQQQSIHYCAKVKLC